MGEGQTTYLQRVIQSKWLGQGLSGLGILQFLLAATNSFRNLWFSLPAIVWAFYSFYALIVFALLGLAVSFRLAFHYKSEQELGIAVFGILINLMLISLGYKFFY